MKEKTKYQVKCRLHKGDEVVILKGKNAGQSGKIDSVDRKAGKVFIAGVNTVRRHSKPTVSNQGGGIIDKIMPIPICKVALLDPKGKKPTRISIKIEGGKKVRYAKKSGTVLQ